MSSVPHSQQRASPQPPLQTPPDGRPCFYQPNRYVIPRHSSHIEGNVTPPTSPPRFVPPEAGFKWGSRTVDVFTNLDQVGKGAFG